MGTPEPSRKRDQRSSRFFKKRMIVKVMLLVAAGAIMNVVVVWAMAVFAPMRYVVSHSGVFQLTDVPTWDVALIPRVGALLVDAEASDTRVRSGPFDLSEVPSWSETARPPTRMRLASNRAFQEIAYGWPSLSLVSRNGCCTWTEDALVVPWFSRYDQRFLPLRPIWPGFAFNTAFYAVVIWMLFAVPAALRRKRRRARGLCPQCAYDLRGRAPQSNVCPECGAAATQPATAA